MHDYLFCAWERFSWFGFYSVDSIIKEKQDDEFDFETDVNATMDIIEALIIHINLPRYNKSMGRNISKIEWYYQLAEYEEKQHSFEELKKRCNSLSGK